MLEKKENLREVFYNGILEQLPVLKDLNIDNIDEKLKLQIQNIIIKIIKLSLTLNIEGFIKLPDGRIITSDNCPEDYLVFFMASNNIISNLHDLGFDKKIKINELPEEVVSSIEKLATGLMATDAFQAMLPNLRAFALEAHESGIPKELIRKTFYDGMKQVILTAVADEFLTVEELEAQETYLYLGIPAFTLLEAIIQSKDCFGIKLLDGRVVTIENCPREENFPLLVDRIMLGKAMMESLYGERLTIPAEELMAIKHLCLSKDTEMPKELEPYRTKAMGCVTIIIEMATDISQSKVFHEIMPTVVEACLEELPEKTNSFSK